MSEIPRKNSWQIAEHGKQARPYGMQRLLSRAVWDDEGVRNEIRTLLVQTLSPPPHGDTREEVLFPFPVIVVDETGIPKRGTHSAGVKVQYCGSTGRVENWKAWGRADLPHGVGTCADGCGLVHPRRVV
jgi:SRSO17 transposase